MIKVFESILIILSTIIGFGVFVLPYTLIHSGNYFWLWFLLVPLSFLLLHLIYSEIIFQIKEKHNLPGLVEKIIGPKFKNYVWILDFFGNQLTFLIYIFVIPLILSPLIRIDPLFIRLIVALFVIFTIFLKVNPFAKLDSILSILLLIIFLILIANLLPDFKIENFKYLDSNFILSYGVLIFAFTGYSSLQIVYDIVGENKKKILLINFVAIFLVTILYLLFTLGVIGKVGINVSEDTISSLQGLVPKEVLFLTIILALLNILTTFIALAFYLKRGLITDYNIPEKISWVITSAPILLFVFWDVKNLANIVSLVGSLFIGFNLIVIIACYLKLQKKDYFKIPNWIAYVLMVFYLFGIIAEILKNFSI